MTTTDVVIIGGGVIGNIIAYYLQAYDISVTIIDEHKPEQQASRAAAGLLAPLGPLSGPGPFAQLLLTSLSRFPALVSDLEAQSGNTIHYEETGALRVVRSQNRLKHLIKRYQSWQLLDFNLNWLEEEAIHVQEPLLTPQVQAAVYAPQEAQIDAKVFTSSIAQCAQQRGVQYILHEQVQHLEYHQHQVVAVHTSTGQRIQCHTVVIAGGAWSPFCMQDLGLQLPVKPQHGQMIQLQQPAQPLRHIIFGEGIYLIPRGSSVLVGATKEETGYTIQVTEKGIQWLRESACRLVPALNDCQIEYAWAGLRPKTPDGYPLLGYIPSWKNVILATGHNSVGILLSPITGESITQLIMQNTVSPLIAPFTPTRFPVLNESHTY